MFEKNEFNYSKKITPSPISIEYFFRLDIPITFEEYNTLLNFIDYLQPSQKSNYILSENLLSFQLRVSQSIKSHIINPKEESDFEKEFQHHVSFHLDYFKNYKEFFSIKEQNISGKINLVDFLSK